MTTATAGTHRRRYLGSYFDEIASRARGAGQGARPTSISVGSRPIPVESWEWDAVSEWARSQREDGWAVLLIEGLAFEARCGADMEHAAASDLQFDAVLGFKLMAEVQRVVEGMVVRGRMDQAKKLTQFRHRINETVTAVGRLVGEASLQEAEALATATPLEPAGGMNLGSDVVRDDAAVSATKLKALVELEGKLQKRVYDEEIGSLPPPAPPQAATGDETQKRPIPTRLVLVSVLAGLTLVWFFVVAWPNVANKPTRGFLQSDFEDLSVIRAVSARPPSLFVTVDDAAWGALTDDDRRRLVAKVAEKIGPAGYTGARFTGAAQRTLAQWLKAGGVRVIDVAKSPS